MVADEVRKLAERTTRATQEIATMTQSIQSETQTAVDGMRSGAQQVADGVELVNATEESLRQINVEMTKTTDMVGEISNASNEQQAAMVEMAQNVERVAIMTEQNVAVVNQTGATVDYLNAAVVRMRKAVQQYGVLSWRSASPARVKAPAAGAVGRQHQQAADDGDVFHEQQLGDELLCRGNAPIGVKEERRDQGK